MPALQQKITSPIGVLYLTASAKGLTGIYWQKQKAVPLVTAAGRTNAAASHLRRAAKELREYFARRRKAFTVALDAPGSAFQKKVWAAIAAIPYGSTVSYKDIATKISRPQSARAVGGATGQNPVCVIVPCHRVIASDGSRGGYSGGRAAKSRLLALEKAPAD